MTSTIISTGGPSGPAGPAAKGASPKYYVYLDPGDSLIHAVNNRTGATDHTGSTTSTVVSALLTDLGSTAATISFSDDTHIFAANITIPTNVGIKAVKGTLLSQNTSVTLALNGNISAGAYIIFGGAGSVVLGTVAAVGCRAEWFASLSVALSAVSTGDMIVSSVQAVSTSLTVPLGVNIEVRKGGSVAFSGSGALVVNGTLKAGVYQIFSGAVPGTVQFGWGYPGVGGTPGASPPLDIYPEWWGPTGNPTVDASNAIQCAESAAGTFSFGTLPGMPVAARVHFRSVPYGIAKTIQKKSNVEWVGVYGGGMDSGDAAHAGTQFCTLTDTTLIDWINWLPLSGAANPPGSNTTTSGNGGAVANPASAPTCTVVSEPSSLVAFGGTTHTLQVGYTYINSGGGETLVSATTTVTVGPGQSIQVQVPTLPTNAGAANFYCSTALDGATLGYVKRVIGQVMVRAFGCEYASIDGITWVGGARPGLTGLLVDSAAGSSPGNTVSRSNPATHNLDFRRIGFVGMGTLSGAMGTEGTAIVVGTGGAGIQEQADTITFKRVDVNACMTGLRVNSSNSLDAAIVEEFRFNGVNRGFHLANGGYLTIRSGAFGGGAVAGNAGNPHTAVVGANIDFAAMPGTPGAVAWNNPVLISQVQGENTGNLSLRVDSSMSPDSLGRITLLSNHFDLPCDIQQSKRIISIGNDIAAAFTLSGANVRVESLSDNFMGGVTGFTVTGSGSVVNRLTSESVVSVDANTLSALLASPALVKHIRVATAQAVTTVVTVPTGVTLEVLQGGLLTFTGSGGLTVNGTLDAGPYQIFGGAGTVALGAGACRAIRAEWWGASPSASAAVNATALAAAIACGNAAGIPVEVGVGTYTFGAALGTLSVKLRGAGKHLTTLTKAFNGDIATLGTGGAIEDLTIQGQGATYTGRGFVVNTGTGQQALNRCRVIDLDGYCLDFTAVDAGTQFESAQCEIWRHAAASGTARYAINIFDAANLAAYPRKWTQLETSGNCAFSFGGCNDLFVSDSVVGDLAYSANSRSVHLGNSRWLNQAACTISGANHTITGMDILPQLTLASGTNTCAIEGNSYNTLPIVDNSGAHNVVTFPLQTYAASLTSGGTAPSLGNGTLVAAYSRAGSTMTVNINLQLGSTTTLGTGGLSFSLPLTRVSGDVALGVCTMSIGGTQYAGFCQIAGLGSSVSPLRDTSGSVTFNSPAVFASGDTIRLTITCNV